MTSSGTDQSKLPWRLRFLHACKLLDDDPNASTSFEKAGEDQSRAWRDLQDRLGVLASGVLVLSLLIPIQLQDIRENSRLFWAWGLIGSSLFLVVGSYVAGYCRAQITRLAAQHGRKLSNKGQDWRQRAAYLFGFGALVCLFLGVLALFYFVAGNLQP